MRRATTWFLVVASVFWHASIATGWAQESRATLEGRVTDPQGAIVPNATVTVTSGDTQVKQTTKTNDQGNWIVQFLNPGQYSLSVSARGFKTAEQKGITLNTADDKQIDVSLEIGATSQQVEVSGRAPLVDTTSSTSGTVIEQEFITEMPSLGRIPTLLAALSPGVQLWDQDQNIGRMWSYLAASQFSVNGGRGERSNEFRLDGMPNVQRSWVAFIPSTDAVAEFRVMSNAYDAQYGRQAGGTINMSVKSGTKNYHGNVYDFIQNATLNANLFQTNLTRQPRPPHHYNLYGGTLGGPLRIPKVHTGKQKTFFFVSFEGIRNVDPFFLIHSVPTALEREGDFSQSFTSHFVGDKRVIDKIRIFDPLSVDTRRTIIRNGREVANSNFGYRKEFRGDRIPAERMNPITLKILQFVPLPNKPNDPTGSDVNNFVPRSTRQHKMASFMTRVDHSWNNQQKSFISLRWNHWDQFRDDYFDNTSTGHFDSRINKGASLDHVWTLSPTRVLDVRYNLTRFEEPGRDHSAGIFDPTTLGLSASLYKKIAEEVARYDPGPCQSFPRINMFGGIGGSCGAYFAGTYHNWNASLTQVHRNMTLHYGGEFRVLQEASGGFGNQSGSFDFSDEWTRRRYDHGERGSGLSVASFLLGLPSGGSLPLDANGLYSQHYLGLFFQNDWRVTPRLTLNMGLRWDFERPFTERYNRMTSYFDPTALNPISDAAQAAYTHILNDIVLADPVKYPFGPQLAQLVPPSSFKVYGVQRFAGVDGQPRTATRGDWHEWQPRFGFAYRVKQRTVIRGGFGRFTQGSGIKGGQRGFSRSTPFIASQDDGLTPYDTLPDPFQNDILEPTGSALGPLTDLGNGVSWENQDPGRPHSWEYSLHLQQEYRGWLFEIGYTHNKTYGIYWGLSQNDPSFELWKSLRTPRFDANGKPLGKPYLADEPIPNPFYQMPGVAYGLAKNKNRSVWDLLRPIKVLGGQSRNDNPWGKNQYDSMQVKIERRFRKGFSLITAFTWSKLFEDTSFWGPEISGPITEHKLGGEDRPYNLSIAPIYDLPVGRGRKFLGTMPRLANAVLGSWELSGQFTIQSGKQVVFGTDSFYDGQDSHLSRNQRTLDRWFDTSHFAAFPNSNDDISLWPAWTGVQNLPGADFKPRPGTDDPQNGLYANFGNYVRRYPTRWADVRGSRVNEVNAGIFKNFQASERMKVQFRAELLNAFNHPRFGAPDTNPHSANFGRVAQVQLNQPRVVQVALKLYF